MWTAFAILAPVVFFLSERGVLRKRRSSQICLALFTVGAVGLVIWLQRVPPTDGALSHTAVPWCFLLNFFATAAPFVLGHRRASKSTDLSQKTQKEKN
ncbi:hypothetical protein [Corynebacterium sp. HMSC073D01]|uniref:hypothetical protein n=1 Tax=Corynebacterium sp. HMSC073D01 TaxID=1739536 RepID=UPI0008A3D402|nr:hypothetical protein [Corynebacterium sp. HMSC073D01]OFO47793.1 hypothetical protein HMPREF3044_09350 [Corynebacterium sp. HMSC073D01]